MKPQVRSALALVAVVAVIGAVFAVHWFIHSSKNPVDTATVWTGDFGAAAIAVPILTLIVTWWIKSRGSPSAAVGTLAQVSTAADWLADAMATRWRREAASRRIITPAPATVRWRWATADLTAPRQEVRVPPVPGTGPAPLPDLGRPGELLGSGVVTRLHDEVYARLPHGRLALIGGPGTGKTGAMILLLLAALDRRASLAGDQRVRVPVPVWLTLGGWNPATTPLREWAADTMNRDYPALRAPDYGAAAANELVRSGRVALFLDGLDEMPEGTRALALKRIDDEARELRVVITSRPLEYELALQGARPDYIAVIELCPVRPEAAAAYLLQGQSGRSRERWQTVGAYLRNNPESVGARALDNPLTLSLARDAYVSQDPAILTDPDRFPTAEAIREHLIDQFLITAYPSEGERERAIRWLAWIAWHMGSSKDLQWWDISGWVPRWKLRLARGIAIGLVSGLSVTIAAGLTYAHTRGTAGGFTAAIGPGIAAAVGLGLIAGLVTRLGVRPGAAAGTGVPTWQLRISRVGRTIMADTGLVARLATWLGARPEGTAGTSAPTRGLRRSWVGRTIIFGLALCLAFSSVAALAAGPGAAVKFGQDTWLEFVGGALLAVGLTRRRVRRGSPPLQPWVRQAIMFGVALGLALSLSLGLASGPAVGVGSAIVYPPVFAGGALLVVRLARKRVRDGAQSGFGDPLDRPFVRATIAALTVGTVAGLWAGLAAGPAVAGTAAAIGFMSGILFGITFSLWGKRGFGLAGTPQVLNPRWLWPRWLLPLGLPLFPLLAPLILNRWATPVADSPSATAASSYRADRRTGIIYASVYALMLGILVGLLTSLDRPSESFTGAGRLMLGLGWATVAVILTWLMAWLAAGQVPLVNLTQLVLIQRRESRVHFRRLLEDAFSRQVLRQAGTVYQFRHAALQANLANRHHQLGTTAAL